jgi:hypothetical protein
MPTWVAPSIAAEMWRVSLDSLMSQIRSGQISAKVEEGFTFVDVDPYGVPPRPPRSRPIDRKDDHPATYRGLTADELNALQAAEKTLAGVDEPQLASWQQKHWREARQFVQRTRIPPRR